MSWGEWGEEWKREALDFATLETQALREREVRESLQPTPVPSDSLGLILEFLISSFRAHCAPAATAVAA